MGWNTAQDNRPKVYYCRRDKMQSERRDTIVFVESAAAMGGVQFSTLYLAQSLDRARWNPIVVCPEEGDLTRSCRDAGVETHVIKYPKLFSTSIRIGRSARLPNPLAWIWNAFVIRRAAQLLANFLRQSSPHVVVTKGLSSHFVGGLACRKSRIPCVWHVQDFISERSFGIYRRVFGWTARWLSQSIIVDGVTIERQLPPSLQPRISVVHNGVDPKVFRPEVDGSAVREELGIPRDHVVIGHAGRITPWKGQHYLIEAFARIAAQYPNVSLLIAGSPVFDSDSYQRRLQTMTAELGLEDRIKFAGFRHDLANVLAAMDIFAFTSIEKDTSPLALLSAMSSGLPIVAFDIEGVSELVDGDQYLLRVPVGRTEDLATSLATLISDEALRCRLGQCARELAERRYTLEQYVNRIERVLLKVTSTSATATTGDVDDFAKERRGAPGSPAAAKTSAVSAVRS